MRGTGGPLLCIGDLLSDVGDEEPLVSALSPSPSFTSSSVSDSSLASDLTKLFQENYEHLNKALAGTDHSWTTLTLKLCTALETANELVQSTNSNVGLLSEKVGELQKGVKRADSAIAAARAVHVNLDEDKGVFVDNAKFKEKITDRIKLPSLIWIKRNLIVHRGLKESPDSVGKDIRFASSLTALAFKNTSEDSSLWSNRHSNSDGWSILVEKYKSGPHFHTTKRVHGMFAI